MTTRTSSWGLLGLFQIDVTISAPELMNLVAQPVNLIGTPGKGKANMILSIVARSEFGTVPFVNPGSAAASINYDGPSKIAATTSLMDIGRQITQPQSAAGNVISVGAGSIGNLTDAELISEITDRNILIGNFSLATPQNFTSGDGSVKVAVLYVTINL